MSDDWIEYAEERSRAPSRGDRLRRLLVVLGAVGLTGLAIAVAAHHTGFALAFAFGLLFVLYAFLWLEREELFDV